MCQTLQAENAELKKQLWDYFMIAQTEIHDNSITTDEEREALRQFFAGKAVTPPFAEGSPAWRVCVMCGKL